MARGKLLVLEGIDGSGKTTQARMLFDEMLRRGNGNVVLTAEPTNNGLGKIIRNELKEQGETIDPLTVQLIFTADRAQHVYNIIEPRLANGSTVICDRYYYSTAAYAYALGLDMEELLRVNSVLFPKPAATVILDVPIKTARERIEKRNNKPDRFENTEMQKKVREGYIKLAKAPKLRWGEVRVIDADSSSDEVHKKIMEEISKHIS
jgi:dTMP kinase